MPSYISYIIKYLIGKDTLLPMVGYTKDETLWHNYKLVIVPSGFFSSETYGSIESEPQLPLREIKGVPILYGESRVEKRGETTILYADVVASTFFLVSRYEEYIHADDCRDMHGRYIGRKSLPVRAGFINRPIVQEYAQLLRELLTGEKGNEKGFSDVYLTHDIDILTYYRTVRSFCGAMKRILQRKNVHTLSEVLKSVMDIDKDPAYTFEHIVAEDGRLPQAKKLYFIKATEGEGFDYPQYNLFGPDFHVLIEYLRVQENTYFGLHTSYAAGGEPKCIALEKAELTNAINEDVKINRHHYLRTVQPSDFESLIRAGFEHDFSMGYADIVGFRLGTCKPVAWINPATKEVTSLILHPLAVMECTLDRENFMNLTYEEAFETVKTIIDNTYEHSGELTLLWHNTTFSDGSYQKHLYSKVIDYICSLVKS